MCLRHTKGLCRLGNIRKNGNDKNDKSEHNVFELFAFDSNIIKKIGWNTFPRIYISDIFEDKLCVLKRMFAIRADYNESK